MAAEKAPAFQFYPKDFLTDSHVVAMTLSERGAYITLLCLCWMEGSLPSDLGALARRCHVSSAAFTRLWPALEPCFLAADGRMVQPRIEREREKQATFRAMKAAAGRLGGRPKADVKQNESSDEANQSPPSSSSSSSSTDVSKNPLTPFQGVRRYLRSDLKEAKRIRKMHFGRCQHDPECIGGIECEVLIAIEIADRRKAAAS